RGIGTPCRGFFAVTRVCPLGVDWGGVRSLGCVPCGVRAHGVGARRECVGDAIAAPQSAAGGIGGARSRGGALGGRGGGFGRESSAGGGAAWPIGRAR